MDRMIYIGMGGAKQAMEQQASVANNMANASTPGFRAQINMARAVPLVGEEAGTRVMVVSMTPGANLRSGPMTQTGRPLDVAIRGEGWLAVQMPDGGEAFTRVGNLQLGAEGRLLTMDSLPLLGDAGPLVVPPGSSLTVAADGVVSALGAGDPAVGMAQVGRLKLVNPDARDLVRGDDGLFRMRAGLPAPQADPNVKLLTGAIEGSNVNAVEVMVDMIANARRFEMQMKTVQTAESNDQQANKLLSNS
ncbi:flagellar basal body rod protein FlgF [Polaromonas sp.]|uniref:flagellar basal body rod protein FlgF n=1 Tax=Polaromonas sp. TaxID=1869339 RepID=UPI0035616367